MEKFLSSTIGFRTIQFIIFFIVVGLVACSIFLSSCNTSRYGIIFNNHTGEAVYYGLPPLDTLRLHFGRDFDYCEIKRVLIFDRDSDTWKEVPIWTQLRPISISLDSYQESIYFHLYYFGEYGDVEGVYSSMMPYYRRIP